MTLVSMSQGCSAYHNLLLENSVDFLKDKRKEKEKEKKHSL